MWRYSRLNHLVSLLLVLLVATGSHGRQALVTANGSVLELPRDQSPITFETTRLRIHAAAGGSHELLVEVAGSTIQHQRGLMYRTAMPENSGMLFIFSHDHTSGFWMYRTHLPLSIAYIASDRCIADIRDMFPCSEGPVSLCQREAVAYRPAQPYRYALEVVQGYFSHRGIQVGDCLEWD
ncbi:DUF192 domain-containing protein [Desulfurispirillum indicum]|uniref:DUF192 domain-containing protein n=1 Tax=Desulfurispirillum indicum (strain ATCC BAA-1389 / DSM 22839 / S5) TaxID=653733 RepID=E6W2B8_DESIS|nr:DUF192 domain-containing protein [Desulfurispirillum indicum]ADU65576.1 protein of unknown function DUF192 [Desulfurispirillum indicum S5]UCZ57592.1 DUF192 domain-containing protein [Desulfurispirillum indicum]